MRNILFEHAALPSPSAPASPAVSPPSIARRLLSISIALQLSGARRPDTEGQILLARYVAGHISLADLMRLL